MRVFTIGHSTRPVEELIQILQGSGVNRVVDVRAFPRSRLHPQFAAEALSAALRKQEIDYVPLPVLGGRRRRAGASSTNGAWQNASFRHYADYARTVEFQTGLMNLLTLASERTVALVCAEACWWRCHRRIIADYLLVRGVPVTHLLTRRRSETAVVTPFAVVQSDGLIAYPERRRAPRTGEGYSARRRVPHDGRSGKDPDVS